MLHKIQISTEKHKEIPLSYQLFGQPLHTAPIIVINHTLTTNSAVAGENGWWKTLVGNGKPIDLEKYTIISFNIPGNGYDDFFIDNFKDFTIRDIAEFFVLGLQKIGIQKVFTLIGGSIGGSVAWEMLAIQPDLVEKFIPIAADYKITDQIRSQSIMQELLLTDVKNPLYKTLIQTIPNYQKVFSLNAQFEGEKDQEKKILKSQDWLNYHGKDLSERFILKIYRLMNHLLTTINVTEQELKNIQAEIHLIAVDTDLQYPAFEIKNTYELLKNNGKNVHYHEIESIDNNDDFLIECNQLERIIREII